MLLDFDTKPDNFTRDEEAITRDEDKVMVDGVNSDDVLPYRSTAMKAILQNPRRRNRHAADAPADVSYSGGRFAS